MAYLLAGSLEDLEAVMENASNVKEIADGVLYLNGTINRATAEDVVAFITEANFAIGTDDEIPKINLMINTHGGCLDSTLSIVGAIRASEVPVTTIATGVCMSGGIMLAMAGHYRLVDEYCNVMSHTLSTESPLSSKPSDIKIWFDNVTAAANKMVMHYKEHSGLDEKVIRSNLLPENGEVYLTAKEAIENYGLFDDLFTSFKQLK